MFSRGFPGFFGKVEVQAARVIPLPTRRTPTRTLPRHPAGMVAQQVTPTHNVTPAIGLRPRKGFDPDAALVFPPGRVPVIRALRLDGQVDQVPLPVPPSWQMVNTEIQ